jgi:hypothetical protein
MGSGVVVVTAVWAVLVGFVLLLGLFFVTVAAVVGMFVMSVVVGLRGVVFVLLGKVVG